MQRHGDKRDGPFERVDDRCQTEVGALRRAFCRDLAQPRDPLRLCFMLRLRQAWGPRKTEVVSGIGSVAGVCVAASASQRCVSRQRKTWSASRTARRASSPLTLGRLSRRCGTHKIFQFQCERFLRIHLDAIDPEDLAEEMFANSRRLSQVDPFEVEPAMLELLGGPDQRCLPGREIERGVALRTPDPHLPCRRETRATRGEVGHRAVLEFDPRVGHIFVLAEKAHAPTAATERTGAAINERSRSRS